MALCARPNVHADVGRVLCSSDEAPTTPSEPRSSLSSSGPPQLPVALGEVVDGKYRIDRLLGAGGMGLVVAATHRELGHGVALKLMKPRAALEPRQVARFVREARAASRLRGEHVARVSDVGRLPNGTPYMVMELLEGQDLGALLATRGPLGVLEAVELMLQACEAIAEAHAHGIVHRDIKPANLFVVRQPNGVPKLKVLDFGISKLADADSVGEAITRTRVMLGTPHYMAPEQMLSARRAEPRSDMWSLGAVLYRALAGRPPFESDSLTELAAMVMRDPPVPPSAWRPDVPAELDAIVLRCLEKQVGERFSSVEELAQALERVRASLQAGGLAPPTAVFHGPPAAAARIKPSGPQTLVWPAEAPPGAAPLSTDTARRSMRTVRWVTFAVAAAVATVAAATALVVLRGVHTAPAPARTALAPLEVAPPPQANAASSQLPAHRAAPSQVPAPAPTPVAPPRPVPAPAVTVHRRSFGSRQ